MDRTKDARDVRREMDERKGKETEDGSMDEVVIGVVDWQGHVRESGWRRWNTTGWCKGKENHRE